MPLKESSYRNNRGSEPVIGPATLGVPTQSINQKEHEEVSQQNHYPGIWQQKLIACRQLVSFGQRELPGDVLVKNVAMASLANW